MSASQKKLIALLAVALLLQTLLMLGTYAVEVKQGASFGGDFIVFYQAAQKLAQGKAAAVYDPSSLIDILHHATPGEHYVTPFVYPPMMALVIWPLGYVSYNAAVALWTIIPLLLFYWLLRRVLVYSEKDAAKLFPLAAAFTLPFITSNILSGQTGTVLAVLFLAGIHGIQKRRWWAGVAFGAMIIKPQMGLLLPFMFLAARQWREMLVSAATVLMFALLATMMLGSSIWHDYLTIIPLFGQFAQERFAAFATLVLGPYMSLHSAGMATDNAACVQAVISVFVIAIVMQIFRSPPQGSPCARFGILATGMLMATPHAMVYDTPILAIAITTQLLTAWRNCWLEGRAGEMELAAFVLMLVMPYLQPILMQKGIPCGWIVMLFFFTVLVRRYYVQNHKLV